VKLKKIIIFFPNFSKGGIEKTSLLLTRYFLDKKIEIDFVSFASLKEFSFHKNRLFKKINILNIDNKIIKFLFSMFALAKVLLNCNRNNTVVFSMQNSIISIIVAKILNFKIIIRNSAPIDYYKIKNYFFGFFVLIIKIFIYKFANLIIANSNNSAKKIKFFFWLKNKTISISNPIELNKKNNFIKKKRKNVVLYAGRLSYEKGVDNLIDGFELFLKKKPYFKLVIIGSGEQKNKLLKKVKNKKLSNKIIFKNWEFNLKQHYLTSKIFILPSYFEGFGNVIIESLNYKLPCISTSTDGPSEILKKGKYGLLIKNNSEKNIAEGLNKVIDNYYHYKYKTLLGFNANKRYSLKNIGYKYLKSIRSTLN
jgi:glycosyltransferase involved in cell wall biosynthesis